MALTAPHADYTSALYSGVKEDYLVKLNWYDADDASTGTVGISMRSSATINSISYTPCITKPPSIREEISLMDYTSSFGNVTIECIDFSTAVSTFPLTNSATQFSAEFHSNNLNRYYLNRTVEIYSMLNDSNNESKCLKIFSGRLTKANVNPVGKTVRLEASSFNPFDHIEVPVARDTDSNVPAPIVYGAYTPNTYGGYATSKAMYQCPILDKGHGNLVRMVARDEAVGSEAHPHYYDEILDQFVPVATASNGSLDGDTLSYNGVYVTLASDSLYRSAKQKPIAYSSDSGSGWTNTDNAFNNASADDSSNYATSQQGVMNINTALSSQTDNNEIGIYDLPKFSGRPTAYTLSIVYKLVGSISSGVSVGGNSEVRLNVRVDDNTFASADDHSEWNEDTNALDVNTIGSTVTSSLHTQTFTVDANATDGFPGQLALRTEALIEEATGSGELEFEHYALLYDIRISCVQAVDFRQTTYGNLQSGMRELLGLEHLYCGADGYTQSWGGALTTIVDMHRDLIYRFGGITATPTDWQAVDTARSNRTVGFSTSQYTSLQKLMNQVQNEGNFIFRVDCTGAYKYIDPHATRTVSASGAYGSELVPNGTFSNTTGWSTDGTSDLTVNGSNQLVVTSRGSAVARAMDGFTTVVGKTYRFTGDFIKGSADQGGVRIGDVAGFNGSYRYSTSNMTSNTSMDFNFTATQTTHYVLLEDRTTQNNGDTTLWDNISVKEIQYFEFNSSSINNWKFDLTPIADVLTKYNLLYDKHPGTEEWQGNDTSTNTSSRIQLGMSVATGTNENTKDQEFHILNSATGVAEWATNKFAFFGGIGMYCEFDVLDPAKYYLEVGDFFKFNSTVGYAFGMSVVDQVWICTSMTRTVGKLKVRGFHLGAEA